MWILIRREDFSIIRYWLSIGDTALELLGSKAMSSFPYDRIQDFCITVDIKGRASFTAICGGRMCEGEIMDAQYAEIERFTTALKEKLHGVINIEVRKN